MTPEIATGFPLKPLVMNEIAASASTDALFRCACAIGMNVKGNNPLGFTQNMLRFDPAVHHDLCSEAVVLARTTPSF